MRTISEATVFAVMGLAIARGLKRADIEKAIGWQSDGRNDRDRRVPIQVVDALWGLLDAEFPGEPLGLQLATGLALGDHGVVGLMTRHAPTVHAAFATNARYYRLVDSSMQVVTTISGDQCTLTIAADELLDRLRHPIEVMLATLFAVATPATANGAQFRDVRFRHEAPAPMSHYSAYFGVPVYFGQSESCLSFDAALLDEPLAAGDPNLDLYLRKYADTFMEDLSDDTLRAIVARTRRAIEEGMSLGDVSQDAVAKMLGTSLRSLQRTLRRAKTNFSTLLDEARLARSRRLLTDQALAIYEIAFLLGYSDTSSFYRAFKRWTGDSPEQYRQKLSAE